MAVPTLCTITSPTADQHVAVPITVVGQTDPSIPVQAMVDDVASGAPVTSNGTGGYTAVTAGTGTVTTSPVGVAHAIKARAGVDPETLDSAVVNVFAVRAPTTDVITSPTSGEVIQADVGATTVPVTITGTTEAVVNIPIRYFINNVQVANNFSAANGAYSSPVQNLAPGTYQIFVQAGFPEAFLQSATITITVLAAPNEACELCVGVPTTGPIAPPRENGLFQASQVQRVDDPTRWSMIGWTWETQYCGPGWTWARPCSTLAVPLDKYERSGGPVYSNAYPFIVGVSVACQPDGPLTSVGDSDYAARARARFEERLEDQIEAVLWADRWGPLGDVTNLIPKDVNVIAANPAAPTVALDPIDGLALLEEVFASLYSRSGVVHAPRRAAHTYANLMQIERRAGRPYTVTGNRWVFGAGYTQPNDPLNIGSPAGAGEVWLVKTGAVAIWVGPLVERNAVDLKTNIDLAVAEAPVAVGYDCLAVAVKVRISCVTCPQVTP